MLLTSVIILVREILEAALLVSVLMAQARRLIPARPWLRFAMLLGVPGALLYKATLGPVTAWFDGVGQEVVNASLQILIAVLLVAITLLSMVIEKSGEAWQARLRLCMVLAVSLAITREGSEILVYLSGCTSRPEWTTGVLVGSAIGAGIGLSCGVLFYYLLISLPGVRLLWTGRVLLLLVAGGLVSQASLLLIQADWLPAQMPLWNTAAWLPEDSVPGQLLYALFGYEATPTPVQVGLHVGSILAALGLMLWVHARLQRGASGSRVEGR